MPSSAGPTAHPRESASTPTSDRRERLYVAVGDVVADKYRVERLIGEGGMAFVVKARHLQLDEPFALKFLRREFLDKAEIVERFAREARAACRIKSEYVARVYDVGALPGNVPFLVMEYLEGKDLDDILTDSGQMPIVEAVELTMQACEALAVAHSQGIIHRDIKPDNLFLVAKRDGLGEIKVLDFGISKLALTGSAFEPTDHGLTGALALGTPLYMSPEQIRSSRSVDERSDIWSLGVVLYELLTNQPAFNGDNVTEVCAAILEREPLPLMVLRPDAPPGLAAIIERCLQKDAAKRYQNVAALAIALLQFAPKRARLFAERSSSVIRAAHPSVAAREELQVPSSVPPPRGGDELIELGPADVDDAFDKAISPLEGRPSQPSGQMSIATVPTAFRLAQGDGRDVAAPSTDRSSIEPEPRGGSARSWLLAGIVVVLVGIGAVVATKYVDRLAARAGAPQAPPTATAPVATTAAIAATAPTAAATGDLGTTPPSASSVAPPGPSTAASATTSATAAARANAATKTHGAKSGSGRAAGSRATGTGPTSGASTDSPPDLGY